MHFNTSSYLLCPQLKKSGTILVSACPSIHASISLAKKIKVRVLKFYTDMYSSSVFFCLNYLPLMGAICKNKSGNKEKDYVVNSSITDLLI